MRFNPLLVGALVGAVGGAAVAAARASEPVANRLNSSEASPIVGAPHYVHIPLEIVVDRPVAEVWARVGKYCDWGDWMRTPCSIVVGKSGEYGAIRTAGPEPIVAVTQYSYTYAMPPRTDRPFEFYHATLEARPLTAKSTKLLYTLFYDDAVFADDAAREKEKARRTERFSWALSNMKILAEGGVLPPLTGPPPGKRTESLWQEKPK